MKAMANALVYAVIYISLHEMLWVCHEVRA